MPGVAPLNHRVCCLLFALGACQKPSLQSPGLASLGPDMRHYSLSNHIEMILDSSRVDAFAKAIAAVAQGQRVLDVGAGAFCLLGRIALKSGAVFVRCLECNPAAAAHAVDVFQMELADLALPPLRYLRLTPAALHPDQMQLIRSNKPRSWHVHIEDAESRCVAEAGVLQAEVGEAECTLLLWPDSGEFPATLEVKTGSSDSDDYDIIVHELLGHICSSEGVVPVMRGLLSRLPSCKAVPEAAGTFFAPAGVQMNRTESALFRLFNGQECFEACAVSGNR